MSSIVLVIAGLHALPPLIGAFWKKFPGLLAGTAVGCVLAVLLGAGRYTVVDLAGVAVGFFLGWCVCRN